MGSKGKGHSGVRYSIAILAGVCFVVASFLVACFYWHSDPAVLPSQKSNQMTDTAVEIRLERARTLFQLGVAIITSLWALVLAKKGDIGIEWNDGPELATFAFANGLLLMSFTAYYVYTERVSSAYFLAGQTLGSGNSEIEMPDVIGSGVGNLLVCQVLSLLFGVVLVAATFLSARRFKGDGR